MASTDFKVHIFNDRLLLTRTLPLKIRLINCMHYLDQQDILICGGVDGTFLIKFDIEYPHRPHRMSVLDYLGDKMYLKLFLTDRLS